LDIPNCDCPDIDPPTGENASICVDDQPFALSVTVPAGMTANWYYEQSSSNSFLDGSTEFVVQDSSAGIYSFFVETYDPATDCSSNVKLKIDVEINDLPAVMDTVIMICDKGNDSVEPVSLQSFNSAVNSSPANTFSYHGTFAEAESNTNALPDIFDLAIGTNVVFVRVTNSAGCTAIAEMQLILNDLPEVDIDFTAPSCFGDSDGQIVVSAIDVDGTMMTSLDGVTFAETTVYNGLTSGDYTVYIQDENECINTYDIEIPDGLEIYLTEFSAECNDNGTDTDPSDDFYTFTLLIENNINNAGVYYVIFNGSTQYTFSYGDSETFILPVDIGNTIDISISDFQFLCTKQQTFGPLNPCSTNCEVNVDVLEYECNDNGTDTDPNDDFYTVTINASAMNGSSNNTYNVFIGGVLLYNFIYGMDETFEVNADGSNLSITCQDNEDIQCQTSMDIGPLVACSGGCQIQLEIQSEECNNNGTSTNQDDDFYTFTIIGNILNGDGLTQFELFVDGISQGLFNYGEDVTFEVNADNMTHEITISDVSNNGCEDSYTSSTLVDCSTDCEITINTLVEVCFDNGTPQNSDDDYYEITINASSVNGAANGLFNLYVDGQFNGDYPYDMNNTITISADNTIHNLRIQDSEELACELEISTTELISCSDACLNELVIDNIECFDNGTATNIDDDYYEFNLRGVLLNGDSNSDFELFVDATSEGVFAYDVLITVTIPADNGIHIISIVDNTDPACTFEIETEELISCSTDCEINIDPIVYTCFDNNTPTDPSDDFVELVVNASAVNGSTTEMYNLYANGVLEGIFMYGSPETITLPAQNQTVTLRFQDSQDLQCDSEIETEILAPCSDGCLIDLVVVNVACFDNGTPTDINDDYYEITIEGEVLNGMPSNGIEILVDNVVQGSSNYGESFVVTIPADNGGHIIDIADLDDSDCSASYTTDILTSCSTDCEINMNDLSFICFDNGTLDDPSDDYYEISFSATAINGGTGFGLTISGNPEGNFSYGEIVNLEFPADGSNLILVLTDLSDQQCILNEVVGPLDPCSDLCTIEPMIIESMCFDNGTPIDPTDDYWEITLFVNPANGETAPNYELRIDGMLEGTYAYSENITVTIPADNNVHQISVNDADDINCDASINTLPLNVCSTPCELSASYDNVICDNNGTNDTGDDDLYYADLTVSNPDAGQFDIPTLSVSGNFNETITIGPFSIADGNLAIEIFDAAQNLCFFSFEVIPPPPCSDCIQFVDAGIGGTISCELTEIVLLGTSSEEGDYAWYGPAGNLVSEELEATAVSIGTYTFSVMYADGCIAEDQVEVMADTDLPITSLSSDGAITCAKMSSILDGSASGSTDDFFFYWFMMIFRLIEPFAVVKDNI